MSADDRWAPLRAVREDLDWTRLDDYAREIERWNRAIRLVGPKELPGIRLQIADALLPFILHAPAFPLLDIGSGAGLPGIPVAIAFPESAVVCLEPLAKRVSFLRQAARLLGLRNVQVVAGRAEEVGDGHLALAAAFATVTARAVAEAAAVLVLARPFVASGGCVVLPRGREEPPAVAGWRLVEDVGYEGPPGMGERRRFTYALVQGTVEALGRKGT